MGFNLNKEQAAAAGRISGQSLIIACPGSGKTTTLLARIQNITNSGVNPSSILMMTFSRAAAEEMAERYKKQTGMDAGVTFQTIHSFCLNVLCLYGGRNINNVIGEGEKRNILFGLIEEEKGINDKQEFVGELALDISNMINSGKTPKTAEMTCCNDRNLFTKLCKGYAESKQAEGKMDFDDMLSECLCLMQNHPEVVEALQMRFSHIQVDEFQDTNTVQAKIIFLLAGKDGNLAVVGDDDQCIYGFRAASPDIMLSFQKRYPKAVVYMLPANYRSVDEIITPAARLIKNNVKRFPKDFQGSRGPGGSVSGIHYDTRPAEVKGIALWAKRLIANGASPSELAILYRTNKQADSIAEALMAEGIPFTSNERISSRYGHWLFHDIISFYTAARGEGGPRLLSRCMNRPKRFFPSAFAECGLDRKKMLIVNEKRDAEDWQKRKASGAILEFTGGMKALAESEGPVDGIPILLKNLRYMEYVTEYANYANEDFTELSDILKSYRQEAEEAGIKDWDAWAGYARKKEEALKAAQKKKKDGPAVMLSTMHRSKGLEWKHVLIADCAEKTTPYNKPGKAMDLEEERRLFYVAMTRARDTLTLTVGCLQKDISRFAEEAGIILEDAGQPRNNPNGLSGRIAGLSR